MNYPEKIPDIHAYCMNGFQWFLTKAWRKRDEDAVVREAVKYKRKIREIGVGREMNLAYLSSGNDEHKSLNRKTPWLWDKESKQFILSEPNLRYYELVKRWLTIDADLDIDGEFCLSMNEKYSLHPFRRNREGIHANWVWDAENWEYQEEYIRRLMELYKSAYGRRYKPPVQLSLEFSHHGSGKLYHDVMYWHERVRKVLDDYTKLENMVFDRSHSESVMGECTDRFRCPRLADCDRGGYHGNDQDNRKAVHEYHWISVWQDLARMIEFPHGSGDYMSLLDIYHLSGNNGDRFVEDGGSYCNAGRGSVWPPPNSGLPPALSWADRKQSYEMAKYIWADGSKTKIIGWWPVSNIQWVVDDKGIVRHEFDHRFSTIKPEFRRLKQMVRAWHEVRG